MRNKMGSEPYFRSSRITSGWQSTPYCGQVRHSKKFGASSRGTVTNPDFLKNPGARDEENSFTAAFSRFCDPQIQQGFSQLFFSVFRIHGDAVHDELALLFLPERNLRSGGDDQSCIPPNLHQAPAVHLRSPSSTERDPSAPRSLLHQGIPGRWLRKTVPAVRSRLSLRSHSSVCY